MNSNKFEEPTIEFLYMDSDDIIVTSGGGSSSGGGLGDVINEVLQDIFNK